MTQFVLSDRRRHFILAADRLAWWIAAHWLAAFNVVYGAYVLGPFLAPILMHYGASDAANVVYTGYSLVCHQLPERSLFLFGDKIMYSYDQIKQVWPLEGFLGLRQFIGNAQFGYKIAWSDRMMSFYGSIWIGGLIFALFRKRIRQLSPIAWLFAGIFPVGLDGITHFINDAIAGTTGAGFRDTNDWLRSITFDAFPNWFYVGDAFGSFNSDMRWITGILFGLTTVWFLFPIIEDSMREVMTQAGRQLERSALTPLHSREEREL
jgi:uncharacterized membrane protein